MEYQKHTENHSYLLGGTDSIPVDQWESWIPSVKYNPKPVNRKLVSLHELLPEGPQKEALMTALLDIRGKAEEQAQKEIAEMESLRGPPPDHCSN